MPKIKTRKSISKRFKVTGSGKIMRRKSFKGHLNVKKSAKRKRRLGREQEMTGFYEKKLRKIMGIKK